MRAPRRRVPYAFPCFQSYLTVVLGLFYCCHRQNRHADAQSHLTTHRLVQVEYTSQSHNPRNPRQQAANARIFGSVHHSLPAGLRMARRHQENAESHIIEPLVYVRRSVHGTKTSINHLANAKQHLMLATCLYAQVCAHQATINNHIQHELTRVALFCAGPRMARKRQGRSAR